jgi:hypothetical protein
MGDLAAWIDEIREQARGDIHRRDVLGERDLWDAQGPLVWSAPRFDGLPSFYPVYRWGDHYSYSPLALILLKGSLRVDPEVAERVRDPGWRFCTGSQTLDAEIRRVGGPETPGFEIDSPGAYVAELARAMREDAARVEDANPGATNVLMCAGKDSLNQLLLPWSNPVLVISAPPNHALVQAFLRDNRLDYELLELGDDASLLEREILCNLCRNDLEHCRWGPDLVRIARSLGGKAVFWKGQEGGRILSRRWKDLPPAAYDQSTYTGYVPWLFGLTRLSFGRGEWKLRRLLERTGFTQRAFFRARWEVVAMWQGAHMSMLRQLTGSLFVSCYHGPSMRGVLSRVDMERSVGDGDVRDELGRALAGAAVRYPDTNPGPAPAAFRAGRSHLAPLLEAAHGARISIV